MRRAEARARLAINLDILTALAMPGIAGVELALKARRDERQASADRSITDLVR